jgi:RNA polymerase sigma-54 factor
MSKLATTIRQKQSIIPKQILQSRFLEMSLEEIEKELENEIQKNPVLVEKNTEDFQSNSDNSYGLAQQDNYDLFFENLTEDKNVIDSLISQIDQSELDSTSKEIAQQIIFNVDNSGFLESELELIADSTETSVGKVRKILDFVKTLSPNGVGSKNLQEFLLMQIDNSNSVALNIVENHFNEFLEQKFSDIKRSILCSDSEFNHALEIISGKNFAPIVDMHNDDKNINPDVVLRLKDDQWLILINDRHLSKYKISNEYLNAAMDQKISKDEKKFIDNHISTAQSLLDTISFRSDSLLKVVKEIIQVQHKYLSGSQAHLNPLKLEDIAKKVNLDISSISRAVKSKYIDTPQGILSLKSFFTSKIVKKSGKIVGVDELKNTIKKIIKSEDRNKPHSDLEIVKLLDKEGFSIARRTVAKHRESMNILNTNKRKLK